MRFHLFTCLALSSLPILTASAQTAATPSTVAATLPAPPRDVPWWISPPPLSFPPTPAPEILDQWLQDKEVVHLHFIGPTLPMESLRTALKLPEDIPGQFRIIPTEGGGNSFPFIQVELKVTPETTPRLLKLQSDLARQNFHLDSSSAEVSLYKADPKIREKARALLPGTLATFRADLQKALPKIQFVDAPHPGADLLNLSYQIPDTTIKGGIRVTPIQVDQVRFAAVSDSTYLCRALGLDFEFYYLPQPAIGEARAPEYAALRKAFVAVATPYIDLDQAAMPPALLISSGFQWESSPGFPGPPLAPDALEKWLADKNIAVLEFTGPFMDPIAVESAFKLSAIPNAFIYGIRSDEDNNRTSIQVCLKTEPAAIRRLLDFQTAAASQKFTLQPATAHAASFRGDPVSRDKARKLIPVILASLRDQLPKSIPGIQCTLRADPAHPDTNSLDLVLPVSNARLSIVAAPININQFGSSIAAFDQALHLRALGMVLSIHANFRELDEPPTPQEQTIRQAFSEAIAPLIDLERSSFPPPPN